MPQTGYRRFDPTVLFSLRSQPHPRLGRISFGASADLQTDMDNRFLRRIWNLSILELESHYLDTLAVTVVPSYERRENDFPIHEGITLPAGADYQFTRYSAALRTATRRVIEVGDKHVAFSHKSWDGTTRR